MNRKIPNDIVEAMREAISPHDTEEVREHYRNRNWPRVYAGKSIDVRYRWDLLWACGYRVTDLYDLYGANDKHIDTALRSIVKPL